MPGIKGLNCSSTTVATPAAATATTGGGRSDAGSSCEKWKFYDNPFFTAAVASAVVEATINQRRSTGQKVRKNTSAGASSSTSTPSRSATRASSSKKSPEVVRQRPADDTNQKLRVELLKAWTSIERLEKAHATARLKAERLTSRLEDGRSLWESQVQDKITSSLQTLKHRLKEERTANKCLEQANQKLEAELMEIRKAVAEARKEMSGERNSKRMIEGVCDELAKEVGEDRAEVNELRKQSAGWRRDADDTRRALQMGEVWKEEKVQGRLTEARLNMEQKYLDLDKVVVEVEEFLDERKGRFEQRHLHGSCDSASSSSCTTSDQERKVYKEQTRLLLNGSGFHMRMNKAYNAGGGPGRAAASTLSNGGMPRIWPRMSDKSKD